MSESLAGEVSVAPIAIAAAGSTAHVAGAVLLVAGGAALAVGAAAAAALVTRAAMTGLVVLSDKLEDSAAEWKKEQQAAGEWADAVVGVSARTARIGALRVALGKAGLSQAGHGVKLPAPFSPAGRGTAELAAWSARADRLIAKAEDALAAQTAASSLRRLARMAEGKSLIPVAEVLASQHALQAVEGSTADAVGLAAQPRPAGPGLAGDDALRQRTAASVGEQFARLPRDVSAEDYATVLATAAKATTATTAQYASIWLVELEQQVSQAQERARRLRDDILTAGRYLSALRLEEFDAGLFPQETTARWAGVRQQLEAVQAGDARLSPELRLEAEDAVQQAQQVADDAFARAQFRLALEQLGYQVLSQDGAEDDALTVSGAALADATARVGISGGRLHATLQPGAAGIGADQVAQWCAAFGKVQQTLSGAGIQARVAESREHPPAAQQDAAAQHEQEQDTTMAPRYRERRR